MYSTIALFVYKRAWHTKTAVESLLENPQAPQSSLIIFSDAPRNESDEQEVKEVRDYIKNIRGFANISIVERTENFGLAKSIITGVSSILEKEETVIVIEDDLKLSPFFLKYMNDGLDVYRDNPKVASIHGYRYPLTVPLPETFFLRGADCWGWATWSRAWKSFNPDGSELLQKIQASGLAEKFDYNGAARNIKMLKKQIDGSNDSWAIRWHAAAFLEDMYTLYPGRSLVFNTGMDGGGTHSASTGRFAVDLSGSPVTVQAQRVGEDEKIVKDVERALRRLHGGVLKRMITRIRLFFK